MSKFLPFDCVILIHIVCFIVNHISMFLPSSSSVQSHYFTLFCVTARLYHAESRHLHCFTSNTLPLYFYTFNWNLPYTIEDVPIWENTNVEVRRENVVKSSNFLVPGEDFLMLAELTSNFIFLPEKCVRHPHLPGISHCQVADFI